MASDAGTRVLILTLHSGEQEIEACCGSVSSQRGVSAEHRVFENLSKAEAHARLYSTIVAESDSFDLFLKLDADMAFAENSSLARIAAMFRRVPDLDHLVLGVRDWFTDSEIIGVHTFSRRARWLPNPSGLFTDPDPVIPGRKIVIRFPRPEAVRHAFNPSSFQAFYFGVHRAMKACQIHLPSSEKEPFGARVDWKTLDRLWRHYQNLGDRRLGLAVYGADLIFQGRLPASAVNRNDPDLQDAFLVAQELADAKVEVILQPRWGSTLPRLLWWFRAMGLAMSLRVSVRLVRDLVTSPIRITRRILNSRFSRLWNFIEPTEWVPPKREIP